MNRVNLDYTEEVNVDNYGKYFVTSDDRAIRP